MKAKKLHIGLAMCLHFSVQGQTDTSAYLQTVTVEGERTAALAKTQFQFREDSVQQLFNPAATMDQWLGQIAQTHVRQIAPGSAASFSARGATSAQSAVLWGGLPINSTATGLTDLSLVPVWLFSPKMTVGGSSAQFGSGAIGGALQLGTDDIEQNGVDFLQEIGSFGTFKTGLKLNVKKKKFWSATSFLHLQSKNDFSFVNQYKIPNVEAKREHAAYQQQHLRQQFGFLINPKNKIEVDFWGTRSKRDSPNNVLSKSPGKAVLTDYNFRGRVKWQGYFNGNAVSASYGNFYEWQSYSDPDVPQGNGEFLLDTNITQTQLIQLGHAKAISQKWKWQSNVQGLFAAVRGSNRQGDQYSISAQTGINFSNHFLEAQAQLRGEFFNGEFLPLSPWFGAKLKTLPNLFVSANVGYVFRTPTLNDRFWRPGGNPELMPENGWSGEVAVFHEVKKCNRSSLIRVAAYQSQLNDYIQWVPGPGGLFSPRNVKEVLIRGIDAQAQFAVRRNKFYTAARAAYAFNLAQAVASNAAGDQSVGEQLVYQPVHKFTSGATFGVRQWYFSLAHQFVGEVNTSYDGSTQPLPFYNLLDARLAKSFAIKKVNCTAIVAANNLLDVAYETMPYFPMPGINYSVTIKINI